MIERTDRMPLAAHEPRCNPLISTCHMGARCARRVAVIMRGSPLCDYSGEVCGGTALCPGYLDASSVRKQIQPGPAPRVHPPLGSE